MQRLKTFFTGESATSDQRVHSWLLLGGTGTISAGVVAHLVGAHHVTCMNRGNHPLPAGVELLRCDVNDAQAVQSAISGRTWDVIVDFLTFTPEEAAMRTACFGSHCRRYVFISSATVYEKPPRTLFMTERTPLHNPYSPYAQQKIRCEAVFRDAYRKQGFPLMIVRPSYTYGCYDVPFVLRPRGKPYSLIARMRAGKPILIPGDGNIFWTITHNSDFARALAGLALHPDTLGEDFHITQDECMTWDAFCREIARAAGAPEVKIVHIASDTLCREKPDLTVALPGDKSQTAVFDNSKLRKYLPDFRFLVPFRDGVAQSIRTLDSDPALQGIDEGWNEWIDEMIGKFG